MTRAICVAIVSLGLGLAAFPACADAIDGDWCHADGKRLSIDGPAVVTPGGKKMTGNYDRHGFDYVIPPGEPGAGQKMVMVLLGEELMHSRIGTAPVQPWKRCGKPVSALPARPDRS